MIKLYRFVGDQRLTCNLVDPWAPRGSINRGSTRLIFRFFLLRLHIQGTRTIIDNLDTGSSVIPILTRYDGFFDCWATVIREETHWGLFKGFGTLLFQYALQLAVIKGSLFTIRHLADVVRGSPLHEPTVPPAVNVQQTKHQHFSMENVSSHNTSHYPIL